MEFKILGPVIVSVDGNYVDLGPPLQRKVLAVLLAHRNNAVPRRTLIAEVWSGDAAVFDAWELDERKRAVLHTYIHRLRVALDPAARLANRPNMIATEGTSYRLLLPDDHVDETRFRKLVEEGCKAVEPEAAVDLLDQALHIWRGQPLGEFGDEPFAKETLFRLHALRLSAIETKLKATLSLGHHHNIIGDTNVRQWLREYPESEGLRSSLALAHYHCGQVDTAAAICRDGLTHLRERGIESTTLLTVMTHVSSHEPNPAAVTLPSTPKVEPSAKRPRQLRAKPFRKSASPRYSLHAGPSRSWWPWAVGILTVAAIAGLSVGAQQSQVAEHATWVAGLLAVGVIAGIVAWRARARLVTDDSTPEQVDAAVQALARMAQRQWRAEVALRQLHDPNPIAVRWEPSTRQIVDHREVTGGSISGRTDQIDDMIAAFRRLRWCRLVVLGPPGSGKSTLIVLLTLQMLAERRADEPVPVLVSLSSWHPRREHLHKWLARRLAVDYPVLCDSARYGRSATKDLVADRRILPVLDGLDELPDRHRPAALTAIDEAMMEGDSIVVACRTTDYEAAVLAGDVLTAAAVVEAQTVHPEDAINYLRQTSPPGTRLDRWQPVFHDLTSRPDGPLAAALSSPLMVMMARLIYAANATNPNELIDTGRFPDQDAIENHLFDRLVPTLIARGSQSPAAGEPTRSWDAAFAHRWLRFLATHTRNLGTYDLAWWQLHQAVPALARRRTRAVLFGLFAWLTAAALYSVTSISAHGIERGLATALKQAAAYGLATAVVGLLASSDEQGRSNHRPQGHGRLIRTMLTTGLAGGSVFAVVSGFGAAVKGGAGLGIVTALAYGLVATVVFGLAPGLAGLLVSTNAPMRANFRVRGRERDLRRMVTMGLAIGSAVGFVIGFIEHTTLVLATEHGVTLPPGLVFGFGPGLVFGLGPGLTFGLIRWARRPIDTEGATSPRTTLNADRALYLVITLLLTLTFILTFAFAAALSLDGGFLAGLRYGLIGGINGGTVLGIVLGLTGAWPLYLLARTWLALRGRLPWRLTSFLEDAHKLGILRQVGDRYQFRHGRLRDHIGRDVWAPAAPAPSARDRSDPW